MDTNSTQAQAQALLTILRSGTVTEEQFWGVQDFLNSVPSRDWDDTMVRLQSAWCDVEEARIASGTHH
jgi:hypothetical protein